MTKSKDNTENTLRRTLIDPSSESPSKPLHQTDVPEHRITSPSDDPAVERESLHIEPGMVLFGYRVLEFVGEGVWSYVYKAQHPKLPMFVAIKQLKPELVEGEGVLKRFLREADIVARLNHPNVVTIYSLEQDEKTHSYYIITEFAEKGTLADRLEKSPEGLSIDEVLHIGMGICNGLEAAHRRGIIHRDIKPDNILMFNVGENQDIPKLSDFGISRAPASTDAAPTSSSGVYGTLYYMSPEQLDDDLEVDTRSDLYSLGILLYELLTGQVPFTGEVHDVFFAHTYVSPKSLRELKPDIPESIEQIVLRALRKDPTDRYQSAADMHEALKAISDVTTREERQRKFESLLEQGLAYLDKEEWEAALDILKQADIMEPGSERAQAGLQKAREQRNLKRLYRLGIQHLGAGNWEEAREHLADIISLDMDYADGQARKQLEKATQELERERSQRDLRIRYSKGMGHFRTQQWDLAIVELERVTELDPEFEDAAPRLAEARQYAHIDHLSEQAEQHIEQEEWEEAVDLLEEIELLNLPYVDVTEKLNYARNKWTGTRKAQQLANLYHEGVIRLACGNLEGAKLSFERIYQRRSDYRDVVNQLQKIEESLYLEQLFGQVSEYESSGEWEQTIEVCRKILTIDPLNQKASRCLARAQKRAAREERRAGRGPSFQLKAELDRTLSLIQELNLRRLVIAFVAGGFCIVLVIQLAKETFTSLLFLQRMLLIGFLLLICVPVSYLAQWFIARQLTVAKPDKTSSPQGLNWTRLSITIIVGILCTFLTTQLTREILISWPLTQRVLLIIFLLFIFVPLAFFVQWFVTRWIKTGKINDNL